VMTARQQLGGEGGGGSGNGGVIHVMSCLW